MATRQVQGFRYSVVFSADARRDYYHSQLLCNRVDQTVEKQAHTIAH